MSTGFFTCSAFGSIRMDELEALVGRVDLCRDHIPALWALAHLSVTDLSGAEDAVVDAIATAATSPSISTADPPMLWGLLAKQVHRFVDGPPTRSSRYLSRAESEAISLVVAGHSANEAAALMREPPRQIHHLLRAGLEKLLAAQDADPPQLPGVAATA